MNISANDYTNNLLNALLIYKNNNSGYGLYEGKSGCLRLAREYGCGLKDYCDEEREDIARSSYGKLCVKFYDLNPPIDAKEWIEEINKVKILNKKEKI